VFDFSFVPNLFSSPFYFRVNVNSLLLILSDSSGIKYSPFLHSTIVEETLVAEPEAQQLDLGLETREEGK
jgi:hypothetical protein